MTSASGHSYFARQSTSTRLESATQSGFDFIAGKSIGVRVYQLSSLVGATIELLWNENNNLLSECVIKYN